MSFIVYKLLHSLTIFILCQVDFEEIIFTTGKYKEYIHLYIQIQYQKYIQYSISLYVQLGQNKNMEFRSSVFMENVVVQSSQDKGQKFRGSWNKEQEFRSSQDEQMVEVRVHNPKICGVQEFGFTPARVLYNDLILLKSFKFWVESGIGVGVLCRCLDWSWCFLYLSLNTNSNPDTYTKLLHLHHSQS